MIKEESLLNIDTKAKIRTLWLAGFSITDICKQLDISVGTWDSYYWRNQQGFRDFVNDCKKEAFLCNAERISKEVTDIKAGDNAKLLAIKQKEAEFLRETLGKELGYSKRPDSVNININKNDPLDPEQKKQLDKILSGNDFTILNDPGNHSIDDPSIDNHSIDDHSILLKE